MSRYVRGAAKPRADFWGDDPLIPSLTVAEREPVNTGLLFPDGSPVMRVNDPIGFGREHER